MYDDDGPLLLNFVCWVGVWEIWDDHVTNNTGKGKHLTYTIPYT